MIIPGRVILRTESEMEWLLLRIMARNLRRYRLAEFEAVRRKTMLGNTPKTRII